jgi:hypothetical protein
MQQAGDFLPGPGLFFSFVLQGLIDPVLFPSASSSVNPNGLLLVPKQG